MTSTSTIPTALDALEDLYKRAFATASLEGNAVQVTQGSTRDAERERVEIADVQNAPQEWETLGGLVNRTEQYEITCWVILEDPRHQTFRDAKNRAFELLAVAESAIRVEDPLGLVASYMYFEVDLGGVTTAHGGPLENGSWGYEISFTVRVEATI